jgi:GxxExxY protein
MAQRTRRGYEWVERGLGEGEEKCSREHGGTIGMVDQERINAITEQIIGAAIEVHRHLGPGLLESTYEACLAYELEKAGLQVSRQKILPVVYKEIQLDRGYRLDLVVNELVIVELKVVEELAKVHEAQMLSYLRLSGYPVGLLINFNVKLLKDGVKRKVL